MRNSRIWRTAAPVHIVPIARGLFVAGAITLSGCPLVHPDTETRQCLESRDCFEQEGEYCDLPAGKTGAPGTCRTRLDPSLPDLSGSRDKARLPDATPGDVLDPHDGSPDGDRAITDMVTDGADRETAPDQGEGMQ